MTKPQQVQWVNKLKVAMVKDKDSRRTLRKTVYAAHHQGGLSKLAIHKATGLARNTITAWTDDKA